MKWDAIFTAPESFRCALLPSVRGGSRPALLSRRRHPADLKSSLQHKRNGCIGLSVSSRSPQPAAATNSFVVTHLRKWRSSGGIYFLSGVPDYREQRNTRQSKHGQRVGSNTCDTTPLFLNTLPTEAPDGHSSSLLDIWPAVTTIQERHMAVGEMIKKEDMTTYPFSGKSINRTGHRQAIHHPESRV